MDNLDDIRTMNDLRPAGYWKARIGELCDRVEELEKENEAMTKERDDRENAQEASPAPRSATEAPASDIWRCRCGWSGSEPDEHPAYAAAYEPNRQLPAPLCPACGRYFMASEFPLDIVSIRAAAQGGLPVMAGQVLALLDDLEETREALDYWRSGEAMRDLAEACRQLRTADAEIARLREASENAQEGRSLPISGPSARVIDTQGIRRAAQEERSSEGEGYWRAIVLALCDYIAELENRDRKSEIVIANFLQLRDEAKAEAFAARSIVLAARAWADAVDGLDGVVAAEERLRAAIRELNK